MDIVTTNNKDQYEFAFVDGDTRTVNIPNPKANITREQIAELNAFIKANNLIVGDKDGGTFAQINKVTRITSQVTTIDLQAS